MEPTTTDTAMVELVHPPSPRGPLVGTTGRRLAVGATVGGALLALTAVLLGPHVLRAQSAPIRPNGGGRPPVQASFPNVGVTESTYEPAHSSGWHVHPGVHSVVVLAGMLSVYDATCARHDFGPGETYLGGSYPHLARNETDQPVTMVLTYVYVGGSPLDHPSGVDAPAGCDVR
jgi:hypothetical protein